MLEINNLTAAYGDRIVLDRVSAAIPAKQVTAILGPNGCGKSTLLKTVCGILKASDGEILLDGENLLTAPQRVLAQKIAYLSQSRQIPDITAERLVLHGRFPYMSYPRRYRPQDHAAAKAAMAQMAIEDLASVPVDQLSGGQRQKVYIAMALAQDTPVILLDEPTTYLDIRPQLQMMRQARALSDRGKTVVMVVHDIAHAMITADRIILMDQGRVAAQGTPETIFDCGMIDKVFGVKLGRVQTGSGWQYYCEEG